MSDPKNLYIYGRNPVEEALQQKPSEIDKIYIRTSVNQQSVHDILDLAKKNEIPVSRVPEQKLFKLVGKVNDQGFVAQISPVRYTDFYDWAENLYLSENPAVLLLNGIEDPHNFGAILRSAAASGINAVIIPTQNQAPVNATVVKTSAGTAGRIPIIRVHDINQAFKDLKAVGFSIVGLDGEARNTIWESNFQKPIAFLIGNEGSGISPSEIKRCDLTLKIPMDNEVDSLNASVTAALICYEWKRKRLDQ